ncbi:prolyl oligopeptidase family serine peptidase [Streptomyces sp. N1]|uniref:alpha/beta hydrolase family protein n=1 Tax=Streptomyces sp. N1 TaxID=576456 RepID=UPI0010135C63|nr:prolyl oligopeptidase family serine peptidase [Streptomyces sp. N1]
MTVAAASPAPPRRTADTVRRVLGEALRLTRPVEARISPDGRHVATAAATPHGARLVLTPAAASPDGTPHGPGPGAPAAERHTPRWLPDSRTLLHVAEPPGGGPARLDALDTGDGTVRTVAQLPGAVEELHVCDDGREALALCAADGAERDGMHLGLPVRLGPAPAPERFAPGLGARTLHHVDLADGRRTEVSPPGLTVWNTAWRGGTLAVATVGEDTLPGGYYEARLARLDLAARTATTLYTPAGQLAAPSLSPDLRTAAVVEGISIVSGRPVTVDLATGAVGRPAGTEDATWLHHAADGTLWYAGWDTHGSRVGHAGPEPRVLWRDTVTLGGPAFQPALSLSADGRLAATVLDAPGRAPETVLAPTSGPDAWQWRPVTALNPDPGPGLAALTTEETRWHAPDGTEVHGLLMYAGPRAAGPRPLALLVHGGPAWLWSAGYAPGDVLGLAPALAAAGHLVLLANPRGSSGRGLDHARAVVGDVGGGDLDDLLAGVRHLAAAGLADPDRTAVLGHSYGGHAAALLAGRTDAFRAAVVVSAPTDWLSFTHTSNIGGGYDRAYALGDPTTPAGREALLARSAVLAAGGRGTPTLLLHGEADRVTPVGQAHELYRSLARAGRAPAELYVYPGEGHEFTDPDHLLDAAARAADWLDTHLGGPAPDPAHPAAPTTPPRAAPEDDVPRESSGAARPLPVQERP